MAPSGRQPHHCPPSNVLPHQQYNAYHTVDTIHSPILSPTLKSALGTNALAPRDKLLCHQKCYFITGDAPVAPKTLRFHHTLQVQHQTSSQQGPRGLQAASTAQTGTVEQASTTKAAPQTAIQPVRQQGGEGRMGWRTRD